MAAFALVLAFTVALVGFLRQDVSLILGASVLACAAGAGKAA